MQFGIDLHGIVLDQLACAFEVARRLDTLDFGQQFAEESTHLGIVVHHHVGLAVLLLQFDHLVGSSLLVHPAGDEGTVAHVGFLNLVTRLDAHQLGHQAVHQVGIELSLVGIGIRQKSQLNQFGVGYVIKAEQVSTGFLDGRAVSLQGIGVNTWKQLARTMAETFVQVGMKFVGQVGIFVDIIQFGLAINKLFVEAIAVGGLVVSIGNVADSHRLGAVLATYPVGVGQVDADGRSRIEVACQDGGGDNLGRHTFHFFFLELLVHRRMVFEPLGIGTDGLRTTGSLEVLEVDKRLPAGFHAQRIAIAFGKAVHEVHARIQILHPQDGIIIKGLQVACFVVFHQLGDDRLLFGCLGHTFGFLQPVNNLLECLTVESAHLPYLFLNTAVFLHQTAV